MAGTAKKKQKQHQKMQYQFIQKTASKVIDPFPGIVRAPVKEPKPALTNFRTKEPLAPPAPPTSPSLPFSQGDDKEPEEAPAQKPRLKGSKPRKLL